MTDTYDKRNEDPKSSRIDTALYRELFHRSVYAMYLTHNGSIVECNRTGENLFGYSHEQIIGKTPLDISPDIQSDGVKSAKVYDEYTKKAAEGALTTFEWIYIRWDGTRVITEMTLDWIESDDELYLLSIVRDVSSRKRNEKIREALFNIGAATSKSDNLDALLHDIHSQLGNLIDVTNCYVALYDDATDTYTLPFNVDEEDKWDPHTPLRLEKTLTDYVRRSEKSLFADQNTWEQLLESGEVKLVGGASKIWMGAPLRTYKGVIGIVAVQSYQFEDLYSRQDLELLEFVADHAAVAIQRRRMEDALRESENRYRLLFSHSPMGVMIYDTNLIITQCNDEFVKIFRSSYEKLINLDMNTLKHQNILPALREALRGGAVRYEGQYHTTTSDVEIWISCTGAPLHDVEGRITGGMAVVQDITDRMEAIEELKIQKAYLEELFEGAPEAIVILDNDDYCLRVNRDFTRLFGYSSMEAIGKKINDLIVPEDLKEEGHKATKSVANGHKMSFESVRNAKDGRLIDVSVLGNPILLGENQLGVYGIYRDITKRKQAEKALREREEQLSKVVDSVDAALWSADVEVETGKFQYTLYTDNIYRITGYDPQAYLSPEKSFWSDILYPDDIAKSKRFDEELFTGDSATCEYRIFHNSGEIRWLFDVASPIKDDDGKVVQVNGVTFDITEIREAQEALAEEKERLAVTLRYIGDAVISTDTDSRVVLLNPLAEELTGWSQEEAIGMLLDELFQLVDDQTGQPVQNPVYEILQDGISHRMNREKLLINRNGDMRIVSDSAAPIRDRNSNIIGVVLTFSDITDRRKLEEELIKAQKLESLGLLAGGIAHDFNNILTAIIANISLARLKSSSKETVNRKLSDAELALFRAKDLTQQLLSFSRGGSPVRKVASIKELIEESAEFALRGSNIKYKLDCARDFRSAEVDEGQINQVIHNLLINASQAMPTGGKIEIVANNVKLDERAGIPIKSGDYLEIKVIDHGIGIPKELIAKIFDPYFTTKQTGSGLGLASSFSIVTNHDGYLTVESKVNVGTTFTVYLPASDEAPPPPKAKQKQIKGSGHILVMDDEKPLLEAVRQMLSLVGYDVSAAQNGEEALKIYSKARESDKPFDVVIMDLTLPGGMGGRETLEKLLEIDPEANAVVSSGYSTDPVMADYRSYGFKGAVAKPYRMEELDKVLKKVMEKKPKD